MCVEQRRGRSRRRSRRASRGRCSASCRGPRPACRAPGRSASSPRSRVFRLRPTATRISSPVTGPWPSSSIVTCAVAAHGGRLRAGDDPSRRAASSASWTCSDANGSSRARMRSPPSTSVTCGAERGECLRHLDADDAAAEDQQAVGDRLGGRDLAVRPRRGVAQAVDRRDQRVAAGRHDDGAARDELVVADRDRALAGDARAARGRPRRRDPSSHGQLRAVVEVVDDLVAAASTAGTSSSPVIGLRRARGSGAPRRPPPAGAAGPWRACRRRTSTRRRRGGARRSRPPGRPRRGAPRRPRPAGPAPITITSNSRWLMGWHPDGMARFVAVALGSRPSSSCQRLAAAAAAAPSTTRRLEWRRVVPGDRRAPARAPASRRGRQLRQPRLRRSRRPATRGA